MTPDELKAEFIRIDRDVSGVIVSVMTIRWDDGPHTPISEWVRAGELPPETTPEMVDAFVDKVMHNPVYFRRCSSCGETNPVGWMHSEDTCQSCAEGRFGVVH